MSRIGKQPIAVPDKVNVTVANRLVTVKGPKGTLTFTHHENIAVASDGKQITVTRPNDERQNRALHGLTRALVNNMVVGVTTGYTKRLKVEGVGYQAAAKDKGVELTVGFANRIHHVPPEGVTVAVPDPTTIVVSGIDKQVVGQFAAEVRASRKPEPYKGKGIRYEGEVVRRKEGKSFAAGK
ncbi:MAG TPA: 50S ribosomal protein L6 [Urbifossiella sp.]|nr:50S ribosomal protein L6 [Urbifossiella sp.]